MYGVRKALSRGPHMGKAVRTEITRDSLVTSLGLGMRPLQVDFPTAGVGPAKHFLPWS